nr:unnamed protein product [Callosobruchus analis]
MDLLQLINEPTRITLSSQTLIDLILTSDHSCVQSSGVIIVANLSDHDLVYCSLNIMRLSKIFTMSKRTTLDVRCHC